MAKADKDSLLTLEFDQYKRYTFLKRAFNLIYGKGRALQHVDPVRVLDVGSGPVHLTGIFFLGDRFRVTRSDVAPFAGDDSDFVLLSPSQPLDLESNSYDAVVSMDVLEHVLPDQRALFLSECARVAKHIVVTGCPNGRSEVTAAEQRARDVYISISGEDHPFLSEHFDLGVPREAEVIAILEQLGLPFMVCDNVRLDPVGSLFCA